MKAHFPVSCPHKTSKKLKNCSHGYLHERNLFKIVHLLMLTRFDAVYKLKKIINRFSDSELLSKSKGVLEKSPSQTYLAFAL